MARSFVFDVNDAGTTRPISVRHGEHLRIEVQGLPAGTLAAFVIAADGDDDPLIEYGGTSMTITPAQLEARGIIEGKAYQYNLWRGPQDDPTWLFDGTLPLQGSILPILWPNDQAPVANWASAEVLFSDTTHNFSEAA